MFDVKPLALVVQAAVLGGQFFDLFSLFDDGGVASKVGVGWSYKKWITIHPMESSTENAHLHRRDIFKEARTAALAEWCQLAA